MSVLRKRRAELEREVAERRRTFNQSRREFMDTVHKETRPMNLVRRNAWPVITGLFTLVSATDFLHQFMPNGGSSRPKSGLLWKALQWSGLFRSSRLAKWALMPVAASLLKRNSSWIFKRFFR